ncbi:MAG TPA: hypothetical protein VEW93_05120 [Acidimicrobiales bacterium]|nr:hypothetical protein [Acidimicrobiales bacterium]
MPAPDLSAPSLPVVAWPDPVVEALGHDPRSTYVERFWLAVLGPSTTWLVRHIAHRFEAAPGGFTLELDAVAGALGLGHSKGRHSPLVRALHRSCQFGVARVTPAGELAARRVLPPLTRHQVERLPDVVRAEHDAWRAVERDAATLDAQHRRARRIALALAELGEDVAATEQRLQRWHIHPVVARDAAVWAHRLMAARAGDPARAGAPHDPLDDLVGPREPGPARPGAPPPAPASEASLARLGGDAA